MRYQGLIYVSLGILDRIEANFFAYNANKKHMIIGKVKIQRSFRLCQNCHQIQHPNGDEPRPLDIAVVSIYLRR